MTQRCGSTGCVITNPAEDESEDETQATPSQEDVAWAAAQADKARAYVAQGKSDAASWSWAGAAAAGASGAGKGAAFTGGNPYAAAAGALVGLIAYGLSAGSAPKAGTEPLAPYQDPVDPFLFWHHRARSEQFINFWPMSLVAVMDPLLFAKRSQFFRSMFDLYLPGGHAAADLIDPFAQALVCNATGAFRRKHPKYGSGWGDRPTGSDTAAQRIGKIRGWDFPSDCRLNLYRPQAQAQWTAVVEAWLDATGLGPSVRPDYDSVIVAEIETPEGQFGLPNGDPPARDPDLRGGIWPHEGIQLESLVRIMGVARPDPQVTPTFTLPLYPIVLWIWRPTSCGEETGCTRPAPAQPVLAGASLVALQLPQGRPVKVVDGASGGGVGTGKDSIWWAAAPLLLGAAGLVIKAVK
jgi:hypothetical protein